MGMGVQRHPPAGAFVQPRKATITLVTSVRPSVRPSVRVPVDAVREIWYWGLYESLSSASLFGYNRTDIGHFACSLKDFAL
jgi:hypothetical protein